MCGIAGSAGFQPSFEQLKAARDAIAHRGPDHQGIHTDGAISLVHTRLSVIDNSDAGNQPMVDKSSGVTLVYNGEIYNFQDLRQDIGPDKFIGHSDTEVILRLYLREGIDCIKKLRGMFALAIWDPRSSELHLARDRLGIKPLMYYWRDGKFAFASEAKSLFALGIECELNLAALKDYLESGRVVHDTKSFFAGIDLVPAGTTMTYRDGKLSSTVFWSAYDMLDQPAPEGDIEEQAWELILDVVQRHLVSDVPVGISLSSGLDSQFLLHILSHLGHKEVDAFTYGFEEEIYDEVRRSERTDFPIRIHRHALRIRPETMIQDLETATRFYEVPIMGLGAMSGLNLMALPREKNVPVMISGEGADEAFCGYDHYFNFLCRELFQTGRHAELSEQLEGYARLTGETSMQPEDQEFKRRILGITGELRASDGTSLSGDAFLGKPLIDLSNSVASVPANNPQDLRSAMLLDMTSQKLPKVTWFHDRNSMASGVETRVPFLDHVLMEFAYRLPNEWLIRKGSAKYLAKRLLQRFCGVNETKTVKHFVAHPQREWLKYNLFEEINAYLDDGILAQSDYINYPAFKDAYAKYAQQAELGNSFFVWKMLSVETFFRSFPDIKLTT